MFDLSLSRYLEHVVLLACNFTGFCLCDLECQQLLSLALAVVLLCVTPEAVQLCSSCRIGCFDGLYLLLKVLHNCLHAPCKSDSLLAPVKPHCLCNDKAILDYLVQVTSAQHSLTWDWQHTPATLMQRCLLKAGICKCCAFHRQ